ncbi:MAG: ATP-binding protein [bacterium]|nr:ATP-binding protein [bacterium]
MFERIGVRYRWYLVLRLVFVLSIPLMGVLSLIRGIQINLIPHIVIISLSLLMSVIFYIVLIKGMNKIFYYYVQIMFDNLLIFAILYFTGGTNSIFEILYFVNIVTGSFFLFAKGGFATAIMSTLGFSLILFGEYFGFIISPYRNPSYSEMMLENLLIKAFIYILSFFLTAAVSGFLSEKLQVRSTEEIARIRLRIRDIIEHIPLSIIILNNSLIVTDFNKKSRELFKKIESNKSFKDIDSELLPYIVSQKRHQFEKKNEYYSMTSEKITYRGKYEDFYIIVISNITDMIEYENKLITKEKMEVIGELAASIAHEIRNPMSNIKGAARILIDEEPEEKKNHPMFKIVLEEIERLNDLVTDFLEFSRTRAPSLEQLNLLELVREVIAVEEKNANIDVSKINQSVIVIGDKYKLKQVLANLISNSIEATEGTKTPLIEINYERESEFDIITVKDNGQGIDEKIKSRIFQPFNTSKKKGTGLGLAIIYKLIKDDHKGEIDFESKAGETIFRIKLRRNID